MNITDVKVLFQLHGHISKDIINEYLQDLKHMSLEDISNKLLFGYHAYSNGWNNFILPPTGYGLLKYTKEPQELPEFEGKFVLGFKTKLHGIDVISDDIEEVIQTWSVTENIFGIPISHLSDGKSNKIKRIDSSFFRF